MRMRYLAFVFLGVAILTGPATLSAQNDGTFKARLSPLPRDATNMNLLVGEGSVTATLAGTKLTINGTFKGLRSPATVARVHLAQTGVRGNPAFELTVSKATSGTVSGTITLSQYQVQDLKKGWLYIQIHSELAPDGNLWGWLLR